MSHQLAPTFTQTQIEDDLARGEIIVSKEGFNVEGGDLEVMLETRNTNAALNDIGAVLGQSDATSIIANLTAKFKDFIGTFTTNIEAPVAPNSLDVIGMRVFDNSNFSYDAPIVTSTPFPEPAKIIDRQFEVDPTTLELTNTIALETIFDYDTDDVRDINTKVQVVTVPVETSNLNFFTNAGANPFTVDSNGNIFVSTTSSQVTKFDNTGAFVLSFNTTASITSMAVDSTDRVFVFSFTAGASIIERFSNTGVFQTSGTVDAGGFSRGDSMGINSLDEVFAVTYENPPNDTGITRLTTDLVIDVAKVLISFGNVPTFAKTMAFDLNDDVYVLDLTDNQLRVRDHTNLSQVRNQGSSASNVMTINNTVMLQTAASYGVFNELGNSIGTINQADGFPIVKGNSLYVHSGGFMDRFDINFGTSTLEVLTRDTNSNFVSRITPTLSQTLPETFATGAFNMFQAKVILSNLSSDEYRAFFLIFENFNSTTPTIASSDWTTTSNMNDGNLGSFDAEEAAHSAATSQTVLDFSDINLRDFFANLQTDIQSGTPAITFNLEGSNDLATFTPITSGSLTDGVLEKITSTDENFRFVRLTQSTIDNTNPFVVIHSLFEVWDNKIVNGLDFSTVLVGGSTAADGVIDQSDPLTFQIVDNGEGLQPNQPFPLEASKFLTMNVTTLRTGQTLQLHRITTVIVQRG